MLFQACHPAISENMFCIIPVDRHCHPYIGSAIALHDNYLSLQRGLQLQTHLIIYLFLNINLSLGSGSFAVFPLPSTFPYFTKLSSYCFLMSLKPVQINMNVYELWPMINKFFFEIGQQYTCTGYQCLTKVAKVLQNAV